MTNSFMTSSRLNDVGKNRCLHSAVEVVLYAVLVQGHEDDVDDDAERDKELRERIEDDKGKDLADLDPQPATVPDAPDLCALDHVLQEDVLELRALLVIVVDERAEVGGFAHWAFRHLVNDVVEHFHVLQQKKKDVITAYYHVCTYYRYTRRSLIYHFDLTSSSTYKVRMESQTQLRQRLK